MASHSSTLAWKIPWMEEPGGLQSMGLWRVWHDWATSLSLFTFLHWRRKWQPTPVFLPGESQGRGSLVGCCLRGCTESDTTEMTQQQQQQIVPGCIYTVEGHCNKEVSGPGLPWSFASSVHAGTCWKSIFPSVSLLIINPFPPGINWKSLDPSGSGHQSLLVIFHFPCPVFKASSVCQYSQLLPCPSKEHIRNIHFLSHENL